jgi:phage repressor protein C with HTH and peptisase S24 domain
LSGELLPELFPDQWFAERELRPEAVVGIVVPSENMGLRIRQGDMIAINTDDRRPRDGEVFAVSYDEQVEVVRFHLGTDVNSPVTWWMISDHPDKVRYPDTQYDRSRLSILGRAVFWSSDRL